LIFKQSPRRATDAAPALRAFNNTATAVTIHFLIGALRAFETSPAAVNSCRTLWASIDY